MQRLKSFLHVFVALCCYKVSFSFASYIGYVVFYPIYESTTLSASLCAILDIGCVLIAIYLYDKYLMKKGFDNPYLKPSLPTGKWVVAAVVIPFALVAFYLLFAEGSFSTETLTVSQMIYAICWSILRSGLDAGIVDEVIFRGVILRSLRDAWNFKFAAVASSLLYALIHFGIYSDVNQAKQNLMILIAGMIFGMALSLVTYETGTIWSAVLIHALYNMLFSSTLFLHIGTAHKMSAIWNYTLTDAKWYLVGFLEMDNLDVGIPSMVAFLLLIVLALWSIRKRRGMAYEETESFTGGR